MKIEIFCKILGAYPKYFSLEDELFYEAIEDSRFDKNRTTTGIEVELTKGLEVGAFYRFENELSRKISDFEHTTGLYIAYKIKRKKRIKQLKNSVLGIRFVGNY